MGTGQEFAKKLGVGGAIAVLVLGIIATAAMFTARGTPVKGYEKPQTDEYYAQHPQELCAQVEDVLLPMAGADGVELAVDGDKVVVTGGQAALHKARMAIIYYYDEALFTFTEVRE